MNSKYNLMLCELHHPNIHGKSNDSDPNIETHYLVYDRFDPLTEISYYSMEQEQDQEREQHHNAYDEHNPNNIDKLEDISSFLQQHYVYLNTDRHMIDLNHPTIRNYRNIISKSNYIKPEIGQCIILPTNEAIAILKTFWLRIVQRRWKNVYTERIRVKMERLQQPALHYRLANGKWPPSCNYLPSLDGMLYDLL